MAKFILKRASEDSEIFNRGFVISPLNYGQELERSKAKSLEDTDGQKGRSSQFIKTESDDKPILNEDSAVSNPIGESNTGGMEKTLRSEKIFYWSKLLVKFFSDKLFRQ